MAIGVLISMPDVTKDEYEQINESVFGRYPMTRDDVPGELILHSAGPAQGGWWVFDIWDSKADFDRFVQERIAPAVREVVGRSMPDQNLTYFEVHNVVPADFTTREMAA